MRKFLSLFFNVFLWRESTCFVTVRTAGQGLLDPARRVATETADQDADEKILSDVDTRVLESMLQESKLDLESEADIRKLLERGTQKKVPNSRKEEEVDTDYSSTMLKTLGNTKLWKTLSAKAADTFESVGIWIGNKVEQDVKTLAALGLFAWERAVKDIGRALPEAGSTEKKRVFLLTNRSNFVDKKSEEMDIKLEMLRPRDELKSVSREIKGILSGQQTSSSGRNLRTTAPSGARNNAERLRRAYRQSRIFDHESRDLSKIPGKVMESAWEVKREIKAETSSPGYKTKPLRSAIAASATNAFNLLGSVRELAKVAAARKKEDRQPRLDSISSKTAYSAVSAAVRIEDRIRPAESETNFMPPTQETYVDPYVVARQKLERDFENEKRKIGIDVLKILRTERRRILKQLVYCIENPSRTWLQGVSDELDSSNENLIGIVTKLVLLRNEIEQRENFCDEQNESSVLFHLLEIRKNLVEIHDKAKSFLPSWHEETLDHSFLGDAFSDSVPLIMLLEDVGDVKDLQHFLLKTSYLQDSTSLKNQPEPEILDAILERVATGEESQSPIDYVIAGDASSAFDSMLREVEVLSVDDDGFEAASRAKKTVEVSEYDEEKRETSESMKVALRLLDVIFLVLEKILFAIIPQAIAMSTTAFERVDRVNGQGKGSIGWQHFHRLGSAEGKY